MLEVRLPVLVKLDDNYFSPMAKETQDVFGGGNFSRNDCLIKTSLIDGKDSLTLLLTKITAKKQDDGSCTLEETLHATFVYNKTTKEFVDDGVENYLHQDMEQLFKIREFVGTQSMWTFLAVALKDKNKYAYDTIVEHGALSSIKGHYRGGTWGNWLKCYKYISRKLSFVESLLKTNPILWSQNVNELTFEEFCERFETKIPAKVTTWLKSTITNVRVYNSLMRICSSIVKHGDGNDAIIFSEYLRAWHEMSPRGIGENETEKFADDFFWLIENGYPTVKLLKYLQRQKFYYGHDNGVTPFFEANLLRDYVAAAQKNMMRYEMFPAWVQRAHNCLVKNIRSQDVSEKVLKNFEERVAAYKWLEGTVGDYVIKVPSTPRDLVDEGNSLNHCVGGYIPRIAEGTSRILFLRKKDAPEVSLYTFEINEELDVIHAKGAYNSDLPEEMEEVFKTWKKRKEKKNESND